METLQEHFGDDVYQNGQINRPALAAKAFRSQESTKLLNSIVGPEIRKLMFEHFEIAKSQSKKIAAVEGAVLIESGSFKLFDEMWVVTLSKDAAYKRIKVRNPNLTDEDIQNRLARQTTDETRLAHC